MRSLVLLAIVICSFNANAQTYFPGSLTGYPQRQALVNQSLVNDSTPGKKWFVTRYGGVSTSFIFSRGGNATLLSVPVGMQLNRRLNNNLYAYAGLSIAPSYITFNRSIGSANFNKAAQNNGFMKSNQLNLYSRAELGLMYINDAKTFSISGSISVERSSYPLFYPAPINTAPPAQVVNPKNKFY